MVTVNFTIRVVILLDQHLDKFFNLSIARAHIHASVTEVTGIQPVLKIVGPFREIFFTEIEK